MTMWTELSGLPFKQTFYDAQGIRTRVIEAGEGEPFIFIHGTGGHAETFLRNFKAHAARMRVISIDAIGHGHTDAPDIEYSIDVLENRGHWPHREEPEEFNRHNIAFLTGQ
jgi:2-hydroxy-6-oxonona-2,4-dienedioate hydrolase